MSQVYADTSFLVEDGASGCIMETRVVVLSATLLCFIYIRLAETGGGHLIWLEIPSGRILWAALTIYLDSVLKGG